MAGTWEAAGRWRLRAGLLAMALLGGALPASAAPVLEQVVLVQRHGVRAPTQSADILARWTTRAWPSWPVGAGELTDKGAQVVALIATAMRNHYVQAGLLAAQGCPGQAVLVWSDARDERTRRSGRMMAQSFAPGCNADVTHLPDGARDPLFRRVGKACRYDPAELSRAVKASGPLVDPASARAIADVSAILRPQGPPLDPEASRLQVSDKSIRLSGPLAIAAASAEIFLLQYAQGLPAEDVAWGQAASPAALKPVLAARDRAVWFARQMPVVARVQGAGMARVMLETLSGQPRATAPAVGAGLKLLAFAGHDDNLSNMAGIFGVDWSLPGQPDKTAPATAFALERWRDPETGADSLSLRIWYAELQGMRALDPASVHAVSVPLPDCPGEAFCPLQTVRARILPDLPAGCGG
ncbi:histidine-type phosphatase [Aquabacter sp. L1I39]|uniref:histidine-type phosphatase n=1 Tax=Aquabacter sp. L1I39 TaxID=2820278 RepID=UPI001ADB22F9|nr:histidine-type phosphatase [Aquabacter sp. L1I39]QTL04584.1 histidine-type phosphatase [Aquabacter sp. L1I39]